MAYDKIIIGAGLYGLYAARFCAKRGEKVLVLEKDDGVFTRATTINQARVHMGYHYPRSLSTALRSAGYFERFLEDFPECINHNFEKIYATSSEFSWTKAPEFMQFCKAANIGCEPLPASRYFKDGLCDGAFLTKEYTYDASILKKRLLKDLAVFPGVQVRFNSAVTAIEKEGKNYRVITKKGDKELAPYVLNASYASVNEVNKLAGFEPFNIKYELCEIIICDVGKELENKGITVMDGPFFSIMPFGKTGFHSLTSVTFTPHKTCQKNMPEFNCQKQDGVECSPEYLGNCNNCPARPKTAWPSMSHLARKYLNDKYEFYYKASLYSMKPILKASEIDDSRPTLIRKLSDEPTFVSVLSGKINTVYDLEEFL